MDKINCLECGKPFVPARIDSKFCSYEHRNRWKARERYRKVSKENKNIVNAVENSSLRTILDKTDKTSLIYKILSLPSDDFIKYREQHFMHHVKAYRVMFHRFHCNDCGTDWFRTPFEMIARSILDFELSLDYRIRLAQEKIRLIDVIQSAEKEKEYLAKRGKGA